MLMIFFFFPSDASLRGKQQHGFMKNKSTVTAGLVLQSLISRALNDNFKP